MKLRITQILFHIFPESFLLIYVSLGLIDVKISIQKHIKITIIYTLLLVILRVIFNLYGFHILILCLILILLFKSFIVINWSSAVVASLLGFIILLLGESIFFPLIFYYFNINIKEFINNSNQILVWSTFVLTKLPLLIISLMIYFFDFHLFKSESLNKIFNSTNNN